MDVVVRCALPVTSLVWRGKDGGYLQTVVCKATFRLTPDRLELSDQQEPPNEYDEYWNEDSRRSVYAPTDLAPHKKRVDVLVVGKAFAPTSEPVASIVARVIVGSVDKAMRVHCDRSRDPEGRLYEGPLFTSMPIVYERAAGGPGTANPVGVGPDARVEGDELRLRLPNLQPIGKDAALGDEVEPISFAPIARRWPGRSRHLGASTAWPDREWRRRPLPHDLDLAYFNAAPSDQQVESLLDEEPIILEGLHRQYPLLATRLPKLRPRATLDRGGEMRAVPMIADTLWIDTDRAICTVTWRGTTPLAHELEAGTILVAIDERTSDVRRREDEANAAHFELEPPRARRMPRPSVAPSSSVRAPRSNVAARDALEFLWVDPETSATALRTERPVDVESLGEAIARALVDGVFTPPVVLVEGTLALLFDGVEEIKAALAVIAPMAFGDAAVEALVESISARIEASWIDSRAPGLPALVARLKSTFCESRRDVRLDELDAEIDRLLVERRRYERSTAFGRTVVRALLELADVEPMPIYLPLQLAEALPIAARFRVRALCEVLYRHDVYQPGALSLRALGMARVLRFD